MTIDLTKVNKAWFEDLIRQRNEQMLSEKQDGKTWNFLSKRYGIHLTGIRGAIRRGFINRYGYPPDQGLPAWWMPPRVSPEEKLEALRREEENWLAECAKKLEYFKQCRLP